MERIIRYSQGVGLVGRHRCERCLGTYRRIQFRIFHETDKSKPFFGFHVQKIGTPFETCGSIIFWKLFGAI
jgi:hypothetical protein